MLRKGLRQMANPNFQKKSFTTYIQSLLLERDAARTSFLSKSWHRAWSTRPNLCFRLIEFIRCFDEFPIFAKKTMQRYEDLNLKIMSFELQLAGNDDSLARELILKAIKLGAIDLTINFVLSWDNWGAWSCFVLPDEVLESQTLTRLSVQFGTVDLQKRYNVVIFPNLKSLHLSGVTVNGDLIRDLVSRCPSIEELRLRHLRSSCPFSFDTMMKLHKLKYLRLEGLDIKDSLSKHDSWPQFACLKELVIENIKLGDVRICCPSLERITIHLTQSFTKVKLMNDLTQSFTKVKVMNAEFDVPNIRYFKFEGNDNIPRLKFRTRDSREWQSDIHIRWSPYETTSASWFSSLNQLLKALGPSRVSLFIAMRYLRGNGDGYVGDGLAIPVVENLTLGGFVASRAFVDALLWCCRPNFINVERRYAEIVDLKVFRQLKKKMTLLDGPIPKELLRFQRKY